MAAHEFMQRMSGQFQEEDKLRDDKEKSYEVIFAFIIFALTVTIKCSVTNFHTVM